MVQTLTFNVTIFLGTIVTRRIVLYAIPVMSHLINIDIFNSHPAYRMLFVLWLSVRHVGGLFWNSIDAVRISKFGRQRSPVTLQKFEGEWHRQKVVIDKAVILRESCAGIFYIRVLRLLTLNDSMGGVEFNKNVSASTSRPQSVICNCQHITLILSDLGSNPCNPTISSLNQLLNLKKPCNVQPNFNLHSYRSSQSM